MKFAFSTLGCPDWSWRDILAAAHDFKYDGVEIRGLGRELYAPRISILQPETLPETKRKLAELGLELSCLTSAIYLFDKSNRDDMLDMGRAYIDTAARADVPYVRVMGDLTPQPSPEIDVDFVLENLKLLAAYARGKQVKVLLETNGIFADTSLAAEVLLRAGEPQAGILWDVHHPYRFLQEEAAVSYAHIKPYLHYLHMKDSQIIDGQLVYRMTGLGDVPNEQVLQLLLKDGFPGYVSLEWVKRWNSNLTEPDIVFPHFISYVRDIVREYQNA